MVKCLDCLGYVYHVVGYALGIGRQFKVLRPY